MYKEIETPVIKKNGDIKYTLVYENKTEEAVPDFQLLDILPYMGDSRGSNFEGTFTIKNIDITQKVEGIDQGTTNLNLYITDSTTVRDMTAKDTGIGTDAIWSNKTIGTSINEQATGFALKGNVAGKTRIEIEITLGTSGNMAENTYANNAMAQVYTNSEQMQTGTVEARVVSRKIQGKVWNDSNRNGVIDVGETFIQGTTIKLLNSTNNAEVTRTTTNANGEYEFNNLNKGTYKVEVEVDSLHELTDKEVGTNREINSKFNQASNQTDEITRLNTISVPEIIEENVNAGIRTIQYNISTEVDGEGGNISGQDEEPYESVDKGQDSTKDIIATPEYGWKVSQIKVNGTPIEFEEEPDHTVRLDKFINMTENKEVVVVFERIESKVIVHYYIENTTTKVPSIEKGKVVEDKTIIGNVGESYTTESAENVDKAYKLISTSGELEGEITEEVKEVIYYYKLKDPTIDDEIEKFSDTLEITDKSQKVPYTIEYNATITDYRGNATVTIVDYLPYEIDEELSNLDGGMYNRIEKTITWTVNIDHINTTTDGAYKVDEQREITVVFSDLDASQKVMVNRVKGTIDLYETEQTNEVEDTYETEIEIPGKVIVKYVDKETGEEIPFREQDKDKPNAETPEGGEQDEETYGYTIKGLVGDEYTTKQKEIYGYTYVENSGNTEGTMTEKDIVVTYYYEKTKAGKVTAIYIDEETGEEITYIEENEETGEQEEKTYKEEIEGYIGDKYETEQKEIPNYDFVRVEGEPEGELTEEEKTVVYIYKKIPAKVIVRYLEKDNTPEDDSDNKVLAEEEVINGHSGDEYKTERKEIEYYRKADPEPENAEGTMTREDIYVTYYYEKIPSGTVTAIYVDEATGEEITYIEENKETGETEEKTYKETYKGYCGEEYKTEAKEIPYYEYIKEKAPENANGIYTEENVTVTYYYRQLPFNMAVDKNLIKIELNGEEQKVKNGKINKVEIPVDRVGDSTLKLEYSIVVSNTGKVEGTTEVIESLPKYFKVTDGTSKEWKKQTDGTLKLATKEIKPGETKEYKVVLEWEKGANNFGSLANTVELTNVENPANFKETTLEDNKSKAELVLAVKSGEDRSMRWVGSTIGVLLILAGMVVYVRRKI